VNGTGCQGLTEDGVQRVSSNTGIGKGQAMGGWFGSGHRSGLYSLGVVVLLVIGGLVYLGVSLLADSTNRVERASPVAIEKLQQKHVVDSAALVEGAAIHDGLEAAAKKEAARNKAQKAAAVKEKEKEKGTQQKKGSGSSSPNTTSSHTPAHQQQASPSSSSSAAASASAGAGASKLAPSATPPNTTMYLTIPKIGLHDIPVLEGTSEAVLSQGVGHVPATGYPWLAGSNTYIAGHRLGYPGTISDHVFWSLPSLVVGDKIILEDSLGQSYTYRVSDILEVSPADLSVMYYSGGSDMVSLQTCIENYGDYWSAGPNWYVRYIVRAQRVA
jgi:sortase A